MREPDWPRPLDLAEFDALMRPLGPFEAAPRLALAISGGRDSMALAILGAEWAGRRGGRAVALTVDHGLRAEAAAEAGQVRSWLTARGIEHRILAWRGPKPASGVQAAARSARYALLTGWCRQHGVLHLGLAHQQEDQAETFLMRLARADAPAGLAAMAALRREAGVRLLRPLLSVPRARLAATLAARGQAWTDDPSNADPAFERTRVGRQLAALAATGIDAERLAGAAAAAGHGRRALQREMAALAGEAVVLAPAGFALAEAARLAAAPGEVRRALLGRLLATVGGGVHLPGRLALARLDAAFTAEAGTPRRSLGGCRLSPWHGRLLISRETRHPPPPLALTAGVPARWDRFLCRLGDAGSGFRVALLGAAGWREARARWPEAAAQLPAPVRPTLPALWRAGRLAAVPHLAGGDGPGVDFSARFRPSRPLTDDDFAVVSPSSRLM
jgi:tRNA(Ile)-lysidine synthase